MSSAATARRTESIVRMELPVMANLGDGWFLVAHPNGAAIARHDYLSVLWSESAETEQGVDDFGELVEALSDEDRSPLIPEAVRAAAVEHFERFAWPFVRGQFYPANGAETQTTEP